MYQFNTWWNPFRYKHYIVNHTFSYCSCSRFKMAESHFRLVSKQLSIWRKMHWQQRCWTLHFWWKLLRKFLSKWFNYVTNTLWKNQKFSLTQNISSNQLFEMVKLLLSRNFWQNYTVISKLCKLILRLANIHQNQTIKIECFDFT